MMQLLTLAAGGGFNPVDPSGGGGLMWTLIIFVLALPPIWIMVMGPVSAALEERDDQASRAIVQAEKASAEAEQARAEVEVKLGEARAEAARLLGEARERASAREREIVDAAGDEARAMVEAARRTIRAEQDKAIAAIREEVVDLSLSAASKVIGRTVGSEDDRNVVAGVVDELKGAAS